MTDHEDLSSPWSAAFLVMCIDVAAGLVTAAVAWLVTAP